MKLTHLSLCAFAVTTAAVVAAALPQGRGAPAADKPRGPAAEDDLSSVYFDAADWDGDGSIRASEAEKSMSVDLAEFALFDTDRDGLIVKPEFAARYRTITERGGVFTAPRGKPDSARPVKKDSKSLLLAYDVDLDGMLAESEVTRALADAKITDPSPLVVLSTFDKDKSGGIGGLELVEFGELLHPEMRSKSPKTSKTLEQLFDVTQVEDAPHSKTIGPRRTTGPITVFRRLDYDRSGVIELSDLEELYRPLRSAVRPAVVLATLDANGDGAISREEFDASMR